MCKMIILIYITNTNENKTYNKKSSKNLVNNDYKYFSNLRKSDKSSRSRRNNRNIEKNIVPKSEENNNTLSIIDDSQSKEKSLPNQTQAQNENIPIKMKRTDYTKCRQASRRAGTLIHYWKDCKTVQPFCKIVW